MEKLKLGELCAGYGGLGLAVEEVFGAELAWYSEFDPAPSKVMAAHWPGVPNHGDMTAIDWAAVEPVDIISGGTPCQDLSAAGRRKGMSEGTRSNLWVAMREAIAVIKPKFVVWENVRGAYSAAAASDLEFCPGCMGADEWANERAMRALGRVLGDLADLGFDAEWRGLPASDMGAPHARFRVFIVATLRDADGANVERIRASRKQVSRLANGSREPRSAGFDLAEHPREAKRGASSGTTASRRRRKARWGAYGPAISEWEAVRGTAPRPTEQSARGQDRLAPEFAEWMMGLPAGWVTGVPDVKRNDQLKALGNGVVPQQAAGALREMLGV